MDTIGESKGILTSLRDTWRRGQTRRVLSGLDESDRLVVGNAFFHDSEVSRTPRPQPVAGVDP